MCQLYSQWQLSETGTRDSSPYSYHTSMNFLLLWLTLTKQQKFKPIQTNKKKSLTQGTLNLPLVSHRKTAVLYFRSACLILDYRKYFHRSVSGMKSQDMMLQDTKSLFSSKAKNTCWSKPHSFSGCQTGFDFVLQQSSSA